jgi:hypothetical protein
MAATCRGQLERALETVWRGELELAVGPARQHERL